MLMATAGHDDRAGGTLQEGDDRREGNLLVGSAVSTVMLL